MPVEGVYGLVEGVWNKKFETNDMNTASGSPSVSSDMRDRTKVSRHLVGEVGGVGEISGRAVIARNLDLCVTATSRVVEHQKDIA